MWPFVANGESQRNTTKRRCQRSDGVQEEPPYLQTHHPHVWNLKDPLGPCRMHYGAFLLMDLCFLSLHSTELFVFRYLEQTKAILYCSRRSLNCDLSKITAVQMEGEHLLRSCIHLWLGRAALIMSFGLSHTHSPWLCLLTSPSVHNLGYNPWNYRLFALQCSLGNLLLQ